MWTAIALAGYWFGIMVSSAIAFYRSPKLATSEPDVIGTWIMALIWPITMPLQIGLIVAEGLKRHD